jgi:hypothetical protein
VQPRRSQRRPWETTLTPRRCKSREKPDAHRVGPQDWRWSVRISQQLHTSLIFFSPTPKVIGDWFRANQRGLHLPLCEGYADSLWEWLDSQVASCHQNECKSYKCLLETRK